MVVAGSLSVATAVDSVAVVGCSDVEEVVSWLWVVLPAVESVVLDGVAEVEVADPWLVRLDAPVVDVLEPVVVG